MNLERQIAQLETELKELIIDWERFFAGDRRTPPQLDRDRLARRLRLLADSGQRAVERFRLEQLQHRFMTYSQMWERMLRSREEGRGAAAGAGAPAPNVRPPGSVDANGDGTSDLYERYLAAKRSIGQSAQVDRAAFEARLDQQRQQLEARLGRAVEFEVRVDDGRVKLAARAADRRKQE